MKATQKLAVFGTTAMVTGAFILSGSASALSAQSTATQQTHLRNIITKGDQEITRRLTSLNSLTSKINAVVKLSASDKATLSSEVSAEVTGLNVLKTKLDAETTLEAAKTDAQQIYSEYRVYALILPKVHLVKLSDDIQATDTKLTTLAGKLQTRINTAQQAGKDVSTLQNDLTDMTSKINAAQNTASQIESGVINLQPSDYNNNHQLLSGDLTQLKSARTDNRAAFTDAKNIIAALKSQS